MQRIKHALLAFGAVGRPLRVGRRIGQNQARRDRVCRGAVRTEFERELPHEADERVFRRSVSLDAGQARAQPGAGRDRHDPAPARRLEMRRGRLGQPERRLDIGLEQHAPVAFRDLLEWPADLAANPAGSKRQNVEPPLPGDHVGDQVMRRLAIG